MNVKGELQHIQLLNYTTQTGVRYNRIPLTYRAYGQALYSAPIVLVNHALTGNSEVSGKLGWWKELVGAAKLIDTRVYTGLAFGIPGNGSTDFMVKNHIGTKDNIVLEANSETMIEGLFALKDIPPGEYQIFFTIKPSYLYDILVSKGYHCSIS